MTDAVKAIARGLPQGRNDKGLRPPSSSLSHAVKIVGSHRRNPPTTRAGRKGVVVYFEHHVAAAIRRLGSDYGATNQELGVMAFKLLFEKLGEPWPA